MINKSQDQTFQNYLTEINNLAFAEADTNALAERIHIAYEANKVTISQYDNLKSELADSVGLANLHYNTHEDYVALELDANARIAEQYGDVKVYVGTIIGRREVYKELCLYATLHIQSLDSTPQIVEGHLKCSTLTELATVARGLSIDKILVIDKETLEILESRTY